MSVFQDFDLMRQLHKEGNKIVLLVMDGLGGLPLTPGGQTELEAANTPNMDRLATEGALGLHVPIRSGVEPGSGPAHMSLFSYDPIRYEVGRGVVESLGVGFQLRPGDIAARGNYATVDGSGLITDRRAGRIPTEVGTQLTQMLQEKTGNLLPGYEVFVLPGKEYRFAFVLRGPGLGGHLTETDPQEVGKAALPVTDQSGTPEGKKTAELINQWVDAARELLASQDKANSLNLRGLDTMPEIPQLDDIYGIRSAAIAVYPLYKGVASMVGMDVIAFEGDRPAHEMAALETVWDQYDYFFIHIKKTDSYGEDGNFDAKVKEIEAVDAVVDRIRALNPGLLMITGDHSTPAKLKRHSFHPVPTLFWGEDVIRDGATTFGESACAHGGLGTFHATNLLPMAMGYARRLSRFGA